MWTMAQPRLVSQGALHIDLAARSGRGLTCSVVVRRQRSAVWCQHCGTHYDNDDDDDDAHDDDHHQPRNHHDPDHDYVGRDAGSLHR